MTTAETLDDLPMLAGNVGRFSRVIIQVVQMNAKPHVHLLILSNSVSPLFASQ